MSGRRTASIASTTSPAPATSTTRASIASSPRSSRSSASPASRQSPDSGADGRYVWTRCECLTPAARSATRRQTHRSHHEPLHQPPRQPESLLARLRADRARDAGDGGRRQPVFRLWRSDDGRAADRRREVAEPGIEQGHGRRVPQARSHIEGHGSPGLASPHRTPPGTSTRFSSIRQKSLPHVVRVCS